MTFQQAVAQQPAWIGYWLNWLLFGGLVLPLALLIWRKTRIAAVVTAASTIASVLGVMWLFDKMGFVKLIGLPHIVFWTPVVVYLATILRAPDTPIWPKRIIAVVLATILISLAFDITDVLRYAFGERAPFAKIN